jgi:AcrR family transcriptional regulator
LTRARVLREAVALADEEGLGSLSMRRLGQRLGVEAMSLYNHVASKDDLLDGMADLVSQEFVVPTPGGDWKQELRTSAVSAHAVLLRHPWAGTILESRRDPGPARLKYLNGVVGVLVETGLPIRQVYLAMLTLDSYIYGFVLQEVSSPVSAEEAPGSAEDFIARVAQDAYPHLVAMAEVVADPAHDRGQDFGAGLTLLLDAIAARLDELTA